MNMTEIQKVVNDLNDDEFASLQKFMRYNAEYRLPESFSPSSVVIGFFGCPRSAVIS